MNYRKWFAEFAVEVALLVLIWWGWDRFPWAVTVALSAIFAVLVVRGFIRDWRAFWRQR